MHRMMAGNWRGYTRMKNPRPNRRGNEVYHLYFPRPDSALLYSVKYGATGWEGDKFVVSWEE